MSLLKKLKRLLKNQSKPGKVWIDQSIIRCKRCHEIDAANVQLKFSLELIIFDKTIPNHVKKQVQDALERYDAVQAKYSQRFDA